MEDKSVYVNRLKETLKEGDVVYTILRSRSASGMSRVISFVIVRDGSIMDIDCFIRGAGILSPTKNGKDGFVLKGCGMDMGFFGVRTLSIALFDNPEALKQRWL